MIKHDGHLRTRSRRKCRKHELQASVFYISRVFPNVRSVLSQCNTRLRLLHLLYDIEVMWRKTIKHVVPMFYTLIKHGFRPIRARVGSYLYYNTQYNTLTSVLLSSCIAMFSESHSLHRSIFGMTSFCPPLVECGDRINKALI